MLHSQITLVWPGDAERRWTSIERLIFLLKAFIGLLGHDGQIRLLMVYTAIRAEHRTKLILVAHGLAVIAFKSRDLMPCGASGVGFATAASLCHDKLNGRRSVRS